MKRVMIIGAAGLLGQYLCAEAAERDLEVTATFNRTEPRGVTVPLERLDITEPEPVSKLIAATRPDVVFLPSALTNVDYCETHPQEAWQVNAEGTFNVAAACKAAKARLFYVSTDYVFNGQKDGKYYEFDTPDPPSVYAQTKLEGERLTLDAEHHNCVARVSVLYGWNRASDKSNFVTWVLSELRKGKEVKLFGDQRVSPTYAPHIAKVMLTMAERRSLGTYHTSGPNCLTRHEMGLLIADTFGLDRSLCRNVRTDEVPLPARRGRTSCLDVNKVEAEFNIQMTSFADGLREMRDTE